MLTRTPTWLRVAIVAAVTIAVAFACGWCGATQRHTATTTLELERAARTSDSLRLALKGRVVAVMRDTLLRDSIVTRWRTVVETLPPAIIERAGRIDTVHDVVHAGAPIIQLADQTIQGLEAVNRRCVSVLQDCERTTIALTTRAERAEAAFNEASQRNARAARWRTSERAVCAVSIATNFIQWRAAQ